MKLKKGQIWAYQFFFSDRIDLFNIYKVGIDLFFMEGLDNNNKLRNFGYPKEFIKNLIYVGDL